LIIDQDNVSSTPPDQVTLDHDHGPASGPRVILQVSRFPWGEGDPRSWLRNLALAAHEIGFHGLALMDHLIQIPQVDRAWEPIPEPWVTLGHDRRLGYQLAGSAHSSPQSPFGNRESSPRLSRPWMRSVTAAPSVGLALGGGCASTRRTAWTFPTTANDLINFRSASRPCERCGHPAPRPTTAAMCTCPKPPAIPVR
jgi:hypothetical protein